jgi:hypothetical protein
MFPLTADGLDQALRVAIGLALAAFAGLVWQLVRLSVGVQRLWRILRRAWCQLSGHDADVLSCFDNSGARVAARLVCTECLSESNGWATW